jgi:transcriptional regulator with XRE-family HTH domain
MGKKTKPAGTARHFVRKWRKLRGYTLEALAADTGSTHATLSRIERGRQPYSQEILEKIAWVLKCTPADLIGRDPTRDRESEGV